MAHSSTHELAHKTKDTASQVGEKAGGVAQNAQENLGAVADAASEYAQQGRQKVEAFGRTVGGQVQERPVSAILLAVGVGVLLGVLLIRR